VVKILSNLVAANRADAGWSREESVLVLATWKLRHHRFVWISNVYMLVFLVYSGYYIGTSLCDIYLATLTECAVYPDILSPNLSFNRMTNLETFLVCVPTLWIVRNTRP